MDLFKLKTYLSKYNKGGGNPLFYYYDFEIKEGDLYCYLKDSKGEDAFRGYGFYCRIHIVGRYTYIVTECNARERYVNIESYTNRKAIAELMVGQINKKGGKNGKIK